VSGAKLSALVLAGGRSRRMRRDKRLISITRRQHLLGSVLESLRPLELPSFLAVADHDAGRPNLPGVAVLWDREAHEGPLRALVDAANGIGGDLLVVAADLPRLQTSFLLELIQRAAAAPPPVHALIPEQEGRLQPLCALYRESIWPKLRDRIDAGQRSLIDALAALEEGAVETWRCDPSEASLHNWNRPEDRQGFGEESVR